MTKTLKILLMHNGRHLSASVFAGTFLAWALGTALALAVFYVPGLHRGGTHIYFGLGTLLAFSAPLIAVTAQASVRIAEFFTLLSFQCTRRDYFISCLLCDIAEITAFMLVIRLLSAAETLLAGALPDVQSVNTFAHLVSVPSLLLFAAALTGFSTLLTWIFIRFGQGALSCGAAAAMLLLLAFNFTSSKLPPVRQAFRDFLLGASHPSAAAGAAVALISLLLVAAGWLAGRKTFYKA